MPLNNQQIDIVQLSKGRTCVVAGAGSGKTTTLIETITKLHEQDRIPLTEMFVATFTNKAAKEIKLRIKKKFNLSDETIASLWIGTFHSLGYRYLNFYKKMKLNMVIPMESVYFQKNIYTQIVGEDMQNTSTCEFKEVLSAIDRKRNSNENWDKVTPYPELCKKVYDLYQEEKVKSDLIDFNDILDLFVKHLKQDYLFRSKFKWVFIDEAQDNNYYQYQLSELLGDKNIMYIGDEKQSLYLWRGACPQMFKDKISKADRVFPLSYNYRSTPKILNFANALLENIPNFKNQKLLAVKKDTGFKPQYIFCDNLAYQVYLNILADIRQGIPLDKIAVLGRSIKPFNVKELQIFLKKDNIPYVLRGGLDILESSYAQNYICLLKSFCSPTKISLLNSLSLLPGVGPKTAMSLADALVKGETSISSLAFMKAKYADTKAMKDFISLEKIKTDKAALLSKSLDFINDHFLSKKYPDHSKKREILYNMFYKTLMEYPTLSSGIDSFYLDEDDEESEDGKIVISTIHSAKGLEFDSVHIVNFNEKSMPFLKGDDEDNASRLEEEFCISYVAVTRAIYNLRMYMQYRSGLDDNTCANKMSRYIVNMLKKYGENYMEVCFKDVEDPMSYKKRFFKEKIDTNNFLN